MFIGTVPASLRLWSTVFMVVSNAWHLERKQEYRQGLTDMMGQEKKSRLYALSTCLVLIGFPFVLFDIVFFLLQSSLLLKNNVFSFFFFLVELHVTVFCCCCVFFSSPPLTLLCCTCYRKCTSILVVTWLHSFEVRLGDDYSIEEKNGNVK